MFKHILISLVLLIVVYFLIQNVFISFHDIYVSPLKIKYTLTNTDQRFLQKYSIDSYLKDIKKLDPETFIFYTTKTWSTKNNNYLLFNDRYYIIEPGYYYFINKNTELFLNNNCKIKIKYLNKDVQSKGKW